MFKVEKVVKKGGPKNAPQFTIEMKHAEMSNYLQSLPKELPSLREELTEINNEIATISFRYNTPNEMTKRRILLDRKSYLKNRIHEIVDRKHETIYFGAVHEILERYYLLRSKTNSFETESVDSEVSSGIKEKKEIIKEYISALQRLDFLPFELNQPFNNLIIVDTCNNCADSNIIEDPESGTVSCINCGQLLNTVIYSDHGYSDSERCETPSTPFSYKRINHFKERLAQFQAKEHIYVPEEIYTKLRAEIKKERIRDLKTLKISKVREYLKKIGASQYYDNIQHIIEKLSGMELPKLNTQMEEILKIRFLETVEVFEGMTGIDRSNFLKYNYVLYQLCKIEGYTQFLPYLTMLKDKAKLQAHDKVWKKICEELGWVFNPTV